MCTLCDSTNINTIMKCKYIKRHLTAFRRHLSKLHSKRRNAQLLQTAHHKRKLWEFLDPSMQQHIPIYDKLLKPRQSFRITLYNCFQLHIVRCLRKALRQISEPNADVVVHSLTPHNKKRHDLYKEILWTTWRNLRNYDVSKWKDEFDVSQGKRLDQFLIQRPKGRIAKLYTHTLLSSI